MARAAYMPAEARCRQLARIIALNPGLTIERLAQIAAIAARSARAYVVRLQREQLIDVVEQEPENPRRCTKWLYPKGAAPMVEHKKAA